MYEQIAVKNVMRNIKREVLRLLLTSWLVFTWLVMWIPVRCFTKLNCCFWYACEQRVKHGGYIRAVPSKRGLWYHFIWVDNEGVAWEFTNSAFDRKDGPNINILLTSIYYGKVRKYAYN